MVSALRSTPTIAAALLLLAIGGAAPAQIDTERGAAPVDDSGSFEVSGIVVDVSGANANAARTGGWRLAQRKGWAMLAKRLGAGPSQLPDGTLDALSRGIVIEREEIGPNRYVARLGVLFDRSRAGAILGVSTMSTRSPPLLVIPVEVSGGVARVFEQRSDWQQAWARFRTGNSTIDYVRPVGTGPDPLLLNAGQALRRGRGWWRTILDQYGADDVLVPEVTLYRVYPGGPVIGRFEARYGPDNRSLGGFSLRVNNTDALPALLDAGVQRLDGLYQQGLRGGVLRPDPILTAPPPGTPEPEATPTPEAGDLVLDDLGVVPGDAASAITIQFDTPGSAAVSAGEAALRAIPGVRSASTTSLALGGTSLMRVTYVGDISVLRAELEARGWRVEEAAGTLRIRRAPAGAAPPAAVPSPAPTIEALPLPPG